MEPITIRINNQPGGDLSVSDPKARCGVDANGSVFWTSEHDSTIKDWRVIFGSYAPVHTKSKIARRGKGVDFLSLVKNRPEDLGHWKYVVVALTEEKTDGGQIEYKLKHLDPELIVDP